jgi:dienelactone hydrolase
METTSDVQIQTEQGIMPAYCAVPTTPPPWPGVVVIHDFTGMSRDLRAQADWLADEGFLAVAPDLYYWGNRLLHRTDRSDRVLHGRWLRVGSGAGARLLGVERQLRRMPV